MDTKTRYGKILQHYVQVINICIKSTETRTKHRMIKSNVRTKYLNARQIIQVSGGGNSTNKIHRFCDNGTRRGGARAVQIVGLVHTNKTSAYPPSSFSGISRHRTPGSCSDLHLGIPSGTECRNPQLGGPDGPLPEVKGMNEDGDQFSDNLS